MRRRLALIVTSLAALLTPVAGAQAAFFPAEPIDGPTPDIRSVSDLDVARDGSGAVAYVRRDGGVDHIFVSRLVSGAWQAPERVDVGLEAASSQAAVAASDGGRLAVVFISGGVAFSVVRPAGAPGWTAPQQLAIAASAPSVDMSINGVAYTTFTSNGDVRAARLDRGATTFTVIDQPLDINAAAEAGTGTNRSKVAIAADGTGVAVWGESGHVYARRLYNGSLSAAPVDLTLDSLDGHAGGAATLPDVAIEDDSSFAWIAFRQAFANGTAPGTTLRAIGRRLRGSRLEDPVPFDGVSWGADGVEVPRITLSGKGDGVATVGTTSGSAISGLIKDDVLNAGLPVGGGGAPAQPVGAIAETLARVVGWVNVSDGTAHGVFYDDKPNVRTVPPAGPDTVLSSPAFGPVDYTTGFEVAGNRTGDFSFVFIQGAADERRLVGAVYDRPPGAIFSYTSSKSWRSITKAPLSWSAPLDLWGPLTYGIWVDGKQVATTQDTKAVVPPGVAPEGVHNWRVVATDRHGQSVTTVVKPLKIDTVAPVPTMSIKRNQRVTTVTAKARDVLPPSGKASGVKFVRIDFGDGSGIMQTGKATHTYRRTGKFTIKVSATDGAGNVGVVTRDVRIGGK
jgi:hypothetical protein